MGLIIGLTQCKIPYCCNISVVDRLLQVQEVVGSISSHAILETIKDGTSLPGLS